MAIFNTLKVCLERLTGTIFTHISGRSGRAAVV